MSWAIFGFSSFLTADNKVDPDLWAILMLVNCVLQSVDAGILIQQNLYAGNMAGKTKFSIPFVMLFLLLAVNIGQHWNWRALAFSLPGAILIVDRRQSLVLVNVAITLCRTTARPIPTTESSSTVGVEFSL